MSVPTNGLIIFIKNPVLGKVKTRLAAVIGAEEALKVYEFLLRCVRVTTLKLNAVQLYLYYSDFIDIADQWENQYFYKNLQKGEDLGEKMSIALREVLSLHKKAVIIGSDCPYISTEIIQEAFHQLESHDMVIGPAKDGGYYLLGLKQWTPKLFFKIAWSSAYVFRQTMEVAERMGWTIFSLPELEDIDHWEDWVRFVGGQDSV